MITRNQVGVALCVKSSLIRNTEASLAELMRRNSKMRLENTSYGLSLAKHLRSGSEAGDLLSKHSFRVLGSPFPRIFPGHLSAQTAESSSGQDRIAVRGKMLAFRGALMNYNLV